MTWLGRVKLCEFLLQAWVQPLVRVLLERWNATTRSRRSLALILNRHGGGCVEPISSLLARQTMNGSPGSLLNSNPRSWSMHGYLSLVPGRPLARPEPARLQEPRVCLVRSPRSIRSDTLRCVPASLSTEVAGAPLNDRPSTHLLAQPQPLATCLLGSKNGAPRVRLRSVPPWQQCDWRPSWRRTFQTPSADISVCRSFRSQ